MISGLETTHRTNARITAGDRKDEDAPRGELHALEQQVIEFFNNKDIIDGKNIAACHTIPQKRNNKPNIIIRFVSRKHKVEVLKLAKKIKGHRGICKRASHKEKCWHCKTSENPEKGKANSGHLDKEL